MEVFTLTYTRVNKWTSVDTRDLGVFSTEEKVEEAITKIISSISKENQYLDMTRFKGGEDNDCPCASIDNPDFNIQLESTKMVVDELTMI